jgi:hypothetical protein
MAIPMPKNAIVISKNIKAANGRSEGSTKGILDVCVKGLPQGNSNLDPDITTVIPVDQCDSVCNAYWEETRLGYL